MSGTSKENNIAEKHNKGEWSEIYVLLYICGYGKMQVVNEHMEVHTSATQKIYKIYIDNDRKSRQEKMVIKIEKNDIVIFIDGMEIKTISREWCREMAAIMFEEIKNGKGNSFSIDCAEEIKRELCLNNIKSPSLDKVDITCELSDESMGFDSIVRYSVKSHLGNKATLLNSSGSTDVRFLIECKEQEIIDKIRNSDQKQTVKQVTESIKHKDGSIKFVSVLNKTFRENLKIIDTIMPDIWGCMIKEYYIDGISEIKNIATKLEETDPLGLKQPNIYRIKIKKMLFAFAVGMIPSRRWNAQAAFYKI